MRYRFVTGDVFTDRAFGGNPLAVLPDARGLDGAAMQRIAGELNLSETVFVLPPADPAHTRHLRIFTPKAEVPFAGHPNVGTAVLLALIGEVEADGERLEVAFEQEAGVVAVAVAKEGGRWARAELTAPVPPALGPVFAASRLARALGLEAGAVVTARHEPRVASAGMGFLCVELAGRAALARAWAQGGEADGLLREAGVTGLQCYTRDVGEAAADLRVRMFAPLHGVPEDPATGSAAVALAGLLAALDPRGEGEIPYRLAQGIEMGRPSLLLATAVKREGRVVAARVGGGVVWMSEGWLDVPEG
jgi:trans-2,3-dihydro-3-hydroxyanthranilate isomerase